MYICLSDRQSVNAYCGGMRVNSQRKLLGGNPPFMTMSLDHFVHKGILTDVSHIPLAVQLSKER